MYVLLLLATFNDSISAVFEMVSGCWDSQGGVNIKRARYSVSSYVYYVLFFYHADFHTRARAV
jgi:hypothetical protein